MGGQVAKDVFFFMETENANLGLKSRSTTNLGTGFQLLDAVAEWRIDKAFNLMGGILRVPYSRESLKAAASTFEIDVQTFNYVQGPSMGWTGGNRDTGFQIRGYFLADHLEYRAIATQGFRQANAKNSFALTGRVQYNFFDTEVYNMPSYPGSYFDGKRRSSRSARRTRRRILSSTPPPTSSPPFRWGRGSSRGRRSTSTWTATRCFPSSRSRTST